MEALLVAAGPIATFALAPAVLAWCRPTRRAAALAMCGALSMVLWALVPRVQHLDADPWPVTEASVWRSWAHATMPLALLMAAALWGAQAARPTRAVPPLATAACGGALCAAGLLVALPFRAA